MVHPARCTGKPLTRKHAIASAGNKVPKSCFLPNTANAVVAPGRKADLGKGGQAVGKDQWGKYVSSRNKAETASTTQLIWVFGHVPLMPTFWASTASCLDR